MEGRNPLYRLTKSFPYLLNRVGVRMGELFVRRIAPYGVTLPMYRVLASLWETGDRRLGDLAAQTTVEVSTLSRLIGEMKRKGLVSRRRCEDNERTVAINLSAKGRALAEELMPIAQHFEDVAVRDFSTDEVARIKTVLATVYSNLDAIEPEIAALQHQPPGRARGAAGSATRLIRTTRRARDVRKEAAG
jgi:MarR family transcriptional regulator, organic hydroperoxide resistance regulator